MTWSARVGDPPCLMLRRLSILGYKPVLAGHKMASRKRFLSTFVEEREGGGRGEKERGREGEESQERRERGEKERGREGRKGEGGEKKRGGGGGREEEVNR